MRFGDSIRLGLAVALLAATSGALAGGDWNDEGIDWRPYAEGLKLAEEGGKPVCLVFYTEWCPHCTNYAKVFHDAGIVEASKAFVMVRLNKDESRTLSAKYATDGEYIPRTYFLASNGTLDPSVHAPRQRYKYFYSENDPASLLAGMEQARKTLVKPEPEPQP